MAAAAPYAAAGLGGLFSAIGGSRSKTATSSSSFNQSGTQTANLSGKQKKVNKNLFAQIMEALRLGPEVSQSERNTARGQVNDSYRAADENLESNLAARGFGSSGKLGAGFRSNEIARANATQGVEATLRDQAQNRFQQMIQNAFTFMTPRSFSSTSSGTQSGTSTMPGQPPFSYLGGGLSDISSMLFARQMPGFGGMGNPFGNSNPFVAGRPKYQYDPGGLLQETAGPGQIGCRVAMELWGEADLRTFLARGWWMKRAASSRRWAALFAAYRITGPLLALCVRRSKRARQVFQSLFDGIITEVLTA